MATMTATREKVSRRLGRSPVASTREVVAFCPKCKTLETLWFIGDKLMATLKFTQRNVKVYHDCGSKEPCRLYRIF